MSTVGDLAISRDLRYLGREFLTWLWFQCEVEGGGFELPSGEFDFVVEDNLAFVGHDEEDSATAVKGNNPSIRPEAASALAAGMTIRRAKLLIAKGELEWSLTLDGETLDLRSVKGPPPEADDPLEQLTERLKRADQIRIAIEELFSRFVELRLSSDWDSLETRRMRDWIRMKLERARADEDRMGE